MTTIETTTDDIGRVLLEQYHEGRIEGTFTVSIEDPINTGDPTTEVKNVTITYEN